ncbi:hypothetical protein ACQKQD_34065, partial [Methylobacterium sp. NPDC080182]|uniref:hypothetical protein n=1 Tax=Methylobacterium sp. NPDC080182 TaxID=3390590 RepID=UPI003D018AD4
MLRPPDHPPKRRGIDVGSDPNAAASAEIDLDHPAGTTAAVVRPTRLDRHCGERGSDHNGDQRWRGSADTLEQQLAPAEQL